MKMDDNLKRLLIAAFDLDQNITEFDGRCTDQIFVANLDEALMACCDVISWEECVDYIYKLRNEMNS